MFSLESSLARSKGRGAQLPRTSPSCGATGDRTHMAVPVPDVTAGTIASGPPPKEQRRPGGGAKAYLLFVLTFFLLQVHLTAADSPNMNFEFHDEEPLELSK